MHSWLPPLVALLVLVARADALADALAAASPDNPTESVASKALLRSGPAGSTATTTTTPGAAGSSATDPPPAKDAVEEVAASLTEASAKGFPTDAGPTSAAYANEGAVTPVEEAEQGEGGPTAVPSVVDPAQSGVPGLGGLGLGDLGLDGLGLDAPHALQQARHTLQHALDEALSEAHAWAQQEDYYADEDEDAAGVLNQTRAELQKALEDVLLDAERLALLGDLDDEGHDRGDSNTVPPVDLAEALKNRVQASQTTSEQPAVGVEATSTPPPTTLDMAPATWTEDPEWRHLVVPLPAQGLDDGGADSVRSADADASRAGATAASPGSTSAAPAAPAAPMAPPLQEDAQQVQTGAQAASVAVASSAWSKSGCPTKPPAPLRLPALPNAALESDNPQCASDSRLLDLHIRNHTLWAVQMQDAGASGVSGLLEGNVYQLGDFDECMRVRGPVRSQYCVAEVRVHAPPRTPDHRPHPDRAPDPVQSVWNHIKHEGEAWRLPLDTLHLAVCAPASCGPRDLQDSLQRALDEHAACSRLPVSYTVRVQESLCTPSRDPGPPFSRGEIVFIAVCVAMLLAVLTGTLLDIHPATKSGCAGCGCCRWLLLQFSLRRSWRALSQRDPRPAGLDLAPLSGARTLNMLVLVVAHRGFNMLRGPVHNYSEYESSPRDVLHTGAVHAQLFVDTFFVMGGLLASLLDLSRAHTHGKDSDSRATLMAAGVHRYVRLTPSYAAVVFFYATLFWRVGSGPLWDQVIGHESEACTKYWWTNLFYVNNYINTDKLCMFQSWYLPCDLHLFLVGSVLTALLSRHRRTGLAFMLAFLGLSVVVPFFVVLLGSKPALLKMLPKLFRAPDQSADFRGLYAPTHLRAAPYMVGLLAGYVFQRQALRQKEERFTQGVTWLLCLGGVLLTTASLLSSVVFYDPDLPYSGVAAGLYAAICPVTWSVGVCLVLASLVLGERTIMSDALSWRPLVVLSRLTYGVYLTHWAFQVASVAKTRAPFHLDVYNLIYLALGDMMASFLTSFLIFLAIEAPFRSLARGITAPPPESKVHLQAAQDKRVSLDLDIPGSIPKQNP